MYNMKSIATSRKALLVTGAIIAIFLGSVITAAAQSTNSTKTPEERAKTLTEKMKTTLSLTDEQYPKIEAINLKYAEKNQSLRSSSKGKLSKYKSLKSSLKDRDKEMKKVLTPEQYEKYKEMMEEMKRKAGDRMD